MEENIYKHLPLTISIVTSTTIAVFWAFTYINNPINEIRIHMASIDTQLVNIESAHEAYGKLAADEHQAIIDLNTKFDKIYYQLEGKGIIK